MRLNYGEYLEKVRGCWAGKNIGGTLGAPMEGQVKIHDVSFYTQELNGVPAPNDDLDLQLIWLAAVEIYGLDQITPHLLGEFWDQCIIAPCSEYSICKMNVSNGFMPPLSGAVNNDVFKYSNGAWIRSEIWACLCPGAPDEAIKYAYVDSCADHCGEGIWAEMFTAAMESAAFVENDVRRLVEIALDKVPEDSMLAKAVHIAVSSYDSGMTWQDTRNRIMEEVDIVQYRAAVNIGFVIVGLLYGDGDFDRSICTAVNCGDDTDCTGATVGALFGIMGGRASIPERWLEPIGESISTICINHFAFNFLYGLPNTLDSLSHRTARAAQVASAVNAMLPRIGDWPTSVEPSEIQAMIGGESASRLLALPLYYLDCSLQYSGSLRIVYPEGPSIAPGGTLRIGLEMGDSLHVNAMFNLRWKNLPEGWSVDKPVVSCAIRSDSCVFAECAISVGEMVDNTMDLELEVEMVGRRQRQLVKIPVQRLNALYYDISRESDKSYRCRTRIAANDEDCSHPEHIIPKM